jgi:hypothetical protein
MTSKFTPYSILGGGNNNKRYWFILIGSITLLIIIHQFIIEIYNTTTIVHDNKLTKQFIFDDAEIRDIQQIIEPPPTTIITNNETSSQQSSNSMNSNSSKNYRQIRIALFTIWIGKRDPTLSFHRSARDFSRKRVNDTRKITYESTVFMVIDASSPPAKMDIGNAIEIRVPNLVDEILNRTERLIPSLRERKRPPLFESGRKICDFRWIFGELFNQELVGYDYWGWIDAHSVAGDLFGALTRYGQDFDGEFDMITNTYFGDPTILTSRGWLTILGNSHRVNTLWRNIPRIDELLYSRPLYAVDELQGFMHAWNEQGLSILFIDFSVAAYAFFYTKQRVIRAGPHGKLILNMTNMSEDQHGPNILEYVSKGKLSTACHGTSISNIHIRSASQFFLGKSSGLRFGAFYRTRHKKIYFRCHLPETYKLATLTNPGATSYATLREIEIMTAACSFESECEYLFK